MALDTEQGHDLLDVAAAALEAARGDQTIHSETKQSEGLSESRVGIVLMHVWETVPLPGPFFEPAGVTQQSARRRLVVLEVPLDQLETITAVDVSYGLVGTTTALA